MFLDVLISLSIQNIIVFIAWVIMTMLFFFYKYVFNNRQKDSCYIFKVI